MKVYTCDARDVGQPTTSFYDSVWLMVHES